MIEVKNIDKSFDGVQVLKNVSAVFENGKTNMIIGASGSGKTVLMKSIIGLHRIDNGKIEYDGRNLPDMDNDHEPARRRSVHAHPLLKPRHQIVHRISSRRIA